MSDVLVQLNRRRLLIWIALNIAVVLICLNMINNYGYPRNAAVGFMKDRQNLLEIANEIGFKRNQITTESNLQSSSISSTAPKVSDPSSVSSTTVVPTGPTLKPPPVNYNYYHFNVSLLTKSENKCKNEPLLDVVIMVKSFIKRFDTRMAVRQTYGNETAFLPHKIRRIFIMGIDPKDDTVRQRTIEENDRFGDIVLGDFKDDYLNNSIKDLLGINWALDYCPNSRFYVVADDDAYISTKNLLDFLNNETLYDPVKKYEQVYLPDDPMHPGQKDKYASTIGLKFYGGFLLDLTVNRDGVFYVLMEEYKHVRYPLYLNGHFFVMSRQAVYELAVAARYVRFFRIDDVYMGYIAHRAGLTPIQMPGVTGNAVDPTKIENFDKIISSHFTNPQLLLNIYRIDDVYMGYIAHRAGLTPIQMPGVTGAAVDPTKIENFDKIISSHFTNPQLLLNIYRQQRLRGNA